MLRPKGIMDACWIHMAPPPFILTAAIDTDSSPCTPHMKTGRRIKFAALPSCGGATESTRIGIVRLNMIPIGTIPTSLTIVC